MTGKINHSNMTRASSLGAIAALAGVIVFLYRRPSRKPSVPILNMQGLGLAAPSIESSSSAGKPGTAHTKQIRELTAIEWIYVAADSFLLLAVGVATYFLAKSSILLLGADETFIPEDRVSIVGSGVLFLGLGWGFLTLRRSRVQGPSLRLWLAASQLSLALIGLYLLAVYLLAGTYARFFRTKSLEHSDYDWPTVPHTTITLALLIWCLVGTSSWWVPRLLGIVRHFHLRDLPTFLDIAITLVIVIVALLLAAAELWTENIRVPRIAVRDTSLPIAPSPDDWLWLVVTLTVGVFAFRDRQWMQTSTGPSRWLARARLTVRRVGVPIVLGGWLIRLYTDEYALRRYESDLLPSPILVALLCSVIFIGAALAWRGRREAGSRSALGATLVGGVIVALAIFVLQFTTEGQRQRAYDRQAAQLTVASRQNLSHFPLSGQDLSGMYMRSKNLRGAQLDLANLEGADLSNADLRDALLDEAGLDGANLTDADLRTASLMGAHLGAILHGADFRGASLCGANLSSAYGIEKADLRGAATDDSTLWPQGFNPRGLMDKDDALAYCSPY
jgi:hypothetical protein